jgi:L-fuconolactonase
LPIVDPHHHLVDRPEIGRYLLPDLLADTGSGHNITATVYPEWLSMYGAQGPVELRPVGEIDFANGVAPMAASGTYGTMKICAGIAGYADLALGASVEKVLEAMIEAGGGRFRGIRFITASHPDQAAWGSPIIRLAGLLMDPKVREGFARLGPYAGKRADGEHLLSAGGDPERGPQFYDLMGIIPLCCPLQEWA